MKTALVTGASGGIGDALCAYLEEQGYHVFAHARLEEQAHSITAGTQRVPVWGDVTKADEAQGLANQVLATGPLDLLVNNAGVLTRDKTLGPNGLGIQAEVNVLAPIVITKALLPALTKSDDPTVIIVSSAIANLARSNDYMKLATPDGSSLFGHYAISKCAANTATIKLAKAYPQLRVVSVEPGFVKTKMTIGNSSLPFPMGFLARYFGATPEKAAHTCFDHVLGQKLDSGLITQSGKVMDSQNKKWSTEGAVEALNKLLSKAGISLT